MTMTDLFNFFYQQRLKKIRQVQVIICVVLCGIYTHPYPNDNDRFVQLLYQQRLNKIRQVQVIICVVLCGIYTHPYPNDNDRFVQLLLPTKIKQD